MRPLAVFAHGVLRFVLDGVIWHNVESALPEPGVLLRAGIKMVRLRGPWDVEMQAPAERI